MALTRERAAALALITLADLAIVAGSLALGGVLHLESRTATVLVGIGAIGNGIGILRFVRAVRTGNGGGQT